MYDYICIGEEYEEYQVVWSSERLIDTVGTKKECYARAHELEQQGYERNIDFYVELFWDD